MIIYFDENMPRHLALLPENKYVRFSAIKDVVKMENKDV